MRNNRDSGAALAVGCSLNQYALSSGRVKVISWLVSEPRAFKMCAAITSPASCEVRSVIRFLVAKNCKASEIHRQLCEVYGPNVMSEGGVRQWCRMFKNGRTNVHDEERSGRPSIVNADVIRLVDESVRANSKFTISELCEHFPQICRTLLYKVITEDLGYRKFSARWVPKLLSEEQKAQRMGAALSFLERYEREGDAFLDQIVTGDETWVRYVNAETKLQSMQWGHTESPKKPTKCRQTLSTRKLMATVFWDRKGILLVEFLERNATINAASYCNTLTNLRRAIQNKRRGMLSTGVIFLHDNARPHTARCTVTKLREFNWEVLEHPPYSPDLAPSDYHLFMHMKKWLGSKRFGDDEELKTSVVGWLQSQAAEFYDCGISKLVKRYDKCLNLGGNYVEK